MAKRTESLSFRLISSCFAVVLFVGAGLTAGKYFTVQRDSNTQLKSRMAALTQSAAAVSLDPLLVEDYVVLDSIAKSFCLRDPQIVQFKLRRFQIGAADASSGRLGKLIVDVSVPEDESGGDLITRSELIRSSGGTGRALGVVSLGFSLKPETDRLRQILLYDLALYTLVFLSLFLVIYALIRRYLSKPLSDLGLQARLLGKGNLEIPISIPKHAELSELATAMEMMRVELRQGVIEREGANSRMAQEIETRRETEAKLQSALEQAETANSYKDRFLSNTSHELRTPLAAILGFTKTLERKFDLCEGEKKDVAAIEKNASHLLAIIEDVLDLSKISSGNLAIRPQVTDVPEILRDIEQAVNAAGEKRTIELRLEFENEESWPKIDTDKIRISQIVRNLIENARRHTNTDVIFVRARMHIIDPDQKVWLQIEVEDRGTGIPEGQFESIFEPFQQLERSDGQPSDGSGLGLSICRKLAVSLGGSLTVQNVAPRGALFLLEVGARPCLAEESHPEELDYEHRPSNILLVDDSEDMRELTAFFLEIDGGHSVTLANDGEEAIARVAQAIDEGRPFDCILMDVRMPVLNGYQAVERMRQIGVTTPTIALTSHAMEGERQRCYDSGYDEYLSKPIDYPKLLATISCLVAESSAHADKPTPQ